MLRRVLAVLAGLAVVLGALVTVIPPAAADIKNPGPGGDDGDAGGGTSAPEVDASSEDGSVTVRASG